ncbi:MAG: NAD(P)H-hydrate dehydratase [Coriobacteriales bacterium]
MAVSAREFTAVDAARLLPLPAEDANKYSRGQVVVAAGSAGYPGAAVLAAQACARSGAGYVSLLVPAPAVHDARAHLLSIPVAPCAHEGGCFAAAAVRELEAHAARARALLLGPGIGRTAECAAFVCAVASSPVLKTLPLVMDADALYALACDPGLLQARCDAGCRTLLTPHEGEAARLLGGILGPREAAARELAQRYGATVVLKGPQTLVAVPDGSLLECRNAGPELAKAGTGDVLAGMIAAFCAQGLPDVDAACLGVYLHGRSGALAAAEQGVPGVMPEDLIARIGQAVCSLEEHSPRLAAARSSAARRAHGIESNKAKEDEHD